MAAVLVLASVAVASAALSDDNRSSGSDDRKVIVLDLLARVVDGADMDVPPFDPAPDVVLADLTGEDEGDGFVLDIEESSKGRPVGRESSICTWTTSRPPTTKRPPWRPPSTARASTHTAMGRPRRNIHQLRARGPQARLQGRPVLQRHHGWYRQVPNRPRRGATPGLQDFQAAVKII
jgi:hypothetical protein